MVDQKKPTITIGIPALNEEANIGYLLQDILNQKEESFVLKKILVLSDGSTDRTVEIAKTVSDIRIEVIEYRDWKGQAFRQNEIFRQASSDIVVLLNADIALSGDLFFTHIIYPITNDRVDLVGAKISSIKAETFVEKVLQASMQLKTALFEAHRGGNNVYTCGGAARAFSRKFYKELHFLNKTGEDAYSYFSCISKGFLYAYAEDAVVNIKLPDILSDHIFQSERFTRSREKYYENFDADMIKREYMLPIGPVFKMVFSSGIKFSLYIFLYACVVFLVRIKSLFGTASSNLLVISKSSKNLRRERKI